jgi:hypothetical protein
MKKLLTMSAALLSLVVLAGCSTSASFKLPPNTNLMIKGERVAFKPEVDLLGYPVLETTPFFWDAVGDINYTLVQSDKVVKEGKLPSQFRIISIFWPPYAYIYWPFGFRLNCYDLTKDFVEECLPASKPAPPKVAAN